MSNRLEVGDIKVINGNVPYFCKTWPIDKTE